MMELVSILYDVYVRHVLISSVLSSVDFSFSLLRFLLKVEKISVFKTDFPSYQNAFCRKTALQNSTCVVKQGLSSAQCAS